MPPAQISVLLVDPTSANPTKSDPTLVTLWSSYWSSTWTGVLQLL